MCKEFWLICYDIPSDKRRTRLHDALLAYGTPVQYSVFECLLDDAQETKLRRTVDRIIKPRLDHVRFYRLCAACRKRIETTRGEIEHLDERDALVV